MGLDITIEVVDDEDYDGNACQIKQATVELDGVSLHLDYSFDGDKPDAEITNEVESDLTDRGYTW